MENCCPYLVKNKKLKISSHNSSYFRNGEFLIDGSIQLEMIGIKEFIRDKTKVKWRKLEEVIIVNKGLE